MKTYHIITMLLLLLLVSCTENKEANALFATADSLLEEHPDSALSMLNRAYNDKGEWRKSQQMRYELLRAKAQNKAYVDFTTDSIMKEVAEYFDNHGTANEQMEAHYLLGCTYRDLGESPMALSCYLDATEKADTLSDDCDYGTLMRIWGQVANEFDRQGMPYKELEALAQFQKCALGNNDSLNYTIGINLERKAHFTLGDTLKAINSCTKALDFYTSHGFYDQAVIALPPLILLHLYNNDVDKAGDLLKYFKANIGKVKNVPNPQELEVHKKFVEANYYECIEKFDSACILYRGLENTSYQYHAYKGLLHIFSKIGNSDSVLYYNALTEGALDEKFSGLHTQAMFNADGMFNYSRNQKLALEKERETAYIRIKTIVITIIGLCVCVVCLTLFLRYKRNKNEELKAIYLKYIEKDKQYQNAIEDYNLMEENFEVYKSTKAKEIELLKESREEASSVFENSHRREILSAICNHDVIRQVLKNEKIYQNHQSEITNEQWESVYGLFRKEVPHLYNSCISNLQLSDRERKILVLTCLGLSTKTSAILMNMTQSNVSNTKACINQKLYSDFSAKSLYNNIIFAKLMVQHGE